MIAFIRSPLNFAFSCRCPKRGDRWSDRAKRFAEEFAVQIVPLVSWKYLSGVANAARLLLPWRGAYSLHFPPFSKEKLVALVCLQKITFLFFCQIKNDGTHNCLDTMGRKSGEAVGLSYCHGLGGNQVSHRAAQCVVIFDHPKILQIKCTLNNADCIRGTLIRD